MPRVGLAEQGQGLPRQGLGAIGILPGESGGLGLETLGLGHLGVHVLDLIVDVGPALGESVHLGLQARILGRERGAGQGKSHGGYKQDPRRHRPV